MDSYKTVKTSLKSVLRDYETIQPQINNLVIKSNELVIQTYQFIRLYILNQYHKNLEIPVIDEKFISYAIKTQGVRDTRGKVAKDKNLLNELENFYQQEFQPLIQKEKFCLKNFSYLIPYLTLQIHTAYQNNIKTHYFKHLLRFINKTCDNELAKEIKSSLFAKKDKRSKECNKWFQTHLKHIIPIGLPKSLSYELKAQPDKFLKCLIYMNSVLEKQENKLFQFCPLRNNIVPKYITLDTACLISFFGFAKNNLTKIKENQYFVFSKIFKLDKKVFKSKNYVFNYTIQTDGVGVSILLVRKDLKHKPKDTNNEKYKYVEEIKDIEKYKDRNIVGVDPGKKFLVFMTDENNNILKYSSAQRRKESMTVRNNRILKTEKERNNIITKETELSKHNSKTSEYQKFKDFIVEKTKLNNETRDFYTRDLWRKTKWRSYIYSRKSEDRFLNRIGETYGKDCVLAFGDWSCDKQMKNYMPTKNIGIRRLIHKRYETISIDEYNTSKKCCCCHKTLDYPKKETIRILRCVDCKSSDCLSSKNKKIVFRTRDLNSATNIRNLFISCMNKLKRPECFTRPAFVNF